MFQVGNQKFTSDQFCKYIDSLPFGPERKAHTLAYVRGFKQLSRLLKSNMDFMRKDGNYQAAGLSGKYIEKTFTHVDQQNEQRLRNLGFLEDVITQDPRAEKLAVIAFSWGAEVCEHFRSSSQSKTLLSVVTRAAMIFPDYTTARRLVNENLLTRLEHATTTYRRKRDATIMDWFRIRKMTPIATPIDPLRLRALGLHLGEPDVVEEGFASDNN